MPTAPWPMSNGQQHHSNEGFESVTLLLSLVKIKEILRGILRLIEQYFCNILDKFSISINSMSCNKRKLLYRSGPVEVGVLGVL